MSIAQLLGDHVPHSVHDCETCVLLQRIQDIGELPPAWCKTISDNRDERSTIECHHILGRGKDSAYESLPNKAWLCRCCHRCCFHELDNEAGRLLCLYVHDVNGHLDRSAVHILERITQPQSLAEQIQFDIAHAGEWSHMFGAWLLARLSRIESSCMVAF